MIKKIYFENFKSFDKTEVCIENITTLIGTNASGKTNMIEGMMILSEIMTGRELSLILDGSKNSIGGIRGGAKGCCRYHSNYFVLGCTVRYDEDIDLEYKVKVGVSDRVMVEEESLNEIKNKSKSKSKQMFYTKEAGKDSGDIAVVCNNGVKGRNPDISCIRFSAVISQVMTKLSQETKYGKKIVDYSRSIVENFRSILFLNPETSLMRNYSLTNDVELRVNASNISSVLYQLCKDNTNKEKLLDIMRKLPENEIKDITFAEGPLNDVILFLLESNGNFTEAIDATRLSDGTLRCLAIVAALLSEKEEGMIVIEEVDNGIHPGRSKVLIKTISEIARERKIDVLITTHNAVLLNALNKQDLMGVEIIYRDNETGSGKFISLTDIKDMASLLANGKLGDVFTDDTILKYIKDEKQEPDYSWLGV